MKKIIYTSCFLIAGIFLSINMVISSFIGSDGYYINTLSRANKLSFDYKAGNGTVKTVTLNLDGTSSDSAFKGSTLYTVLQEKVLGDVLPLDYRTMRTNDKASYLNFRGSSVYELIFNNGVLKEVVKTTRPDNKTSKEIVERFSNFVILRG